MHKGKVENGACPHRYASLPARRLNKYPRTCVQQSNPGSSGTPVFSRSGYTRSGCSSQLAVSVRAAFPFRWNYVSWHCRKRNVLQDSCLTERSPETRHIDQIENLPLVGKELESEHSHRPVSSRPHQARSQGWSSTTRSRRSAEILSNRILRFSSCTRLVGASIGISLRRKNNPFHSVNQGPCVWNQSALPSDARVLAKPCFPPR